MTVCTVIARSSGAISPRVQPAVLRLMKALQPKVDGKMYPTHCQNWGIADSGQEKPVRNMHIGDTDKNSTNTVSRRQMRLDHVKVKKIQSMI